MIFVLCLARSILSVLAAMALGLSHRSAHKHHTDRFMRLCSNRVAGSPYHWSHAVPDDLGKADLLDGAYYLALRQKDQNIQQAGFPDGHPL
jgi:hypothetical protein